MKNTKWLVVAWAILIALGLFGEDLQKWWHGEPKIEKVNNEVDTAAWGLENQENADEEKEEREQPEDSFFWSLAPDKALASFRRFEKTYKADFGRDFKYEVCVDFPKREMVYCLSIRKWLIGRFEEALSLYSEVHFNDSGESLYRGDIYKEDNIAQFYRDRLFKLIDMGEDEDENNYPYGLYQHIYMKAFIATGKFVSYQGFVDNYWGGIHGLYLERVYSFDPANQKEIDWEYLFKPQSKEDIMMLIFEEASNDKKYRYWERDETMTEIRENFLKQDDEGELTNEYKDVSVGLVKEGVVFSYQPYVLSCFAAGAFHFVVPYEKLEPYMTPEGKMILKE